jgi:hypothetical protein
MVLKVTSWLRIVVTLSTLGWLRWDKRGITWDFGLWPPTFFALQGGKF